jgi:hypothetical protein
MRLWSGAAAAETRAGAAARREIGIMRIALFSLMLCEADTLDALRAGKLAVKTDGVDAGAGRRINHLLYL